MRAVWYWRQTANHQPAHRIEGHRRPPWKDTRRAIWRRMRRAFVRSEDRCHG